MPIGKNQRGDWRGVRGGQQAREALTALGSPKQDRLLDMMKEGSSFGSVSKKKKEGGQRGEKARWGARSLAYAI